MRTLLPIALVAALAACTGERGAPVDDSAAIPPEADGQPASHPPVDTPAAVRPGNDGGASFAGYGEMMFGTAAADMARAWGGALKEVGKDFNDHCYFMTPVWVKTPAEFNFMVSEGRFVRFGTESTLYVAPGGGKVGMRKAEIAVLYADVEQQPHKYTDGLYLRVRDPAGGNGVLVFEADGKGEAASVTEWRVGVAPEVDYVEGCS